jgi:hypothetical protein
MHRTHAPLISSALNEYGFQKDCGPARTPLAVAKPIDDRSNGHDEASHKQHDQGKMERRSHQLL